MHAPRRAQVGQRLNGLRIVDCGLRVVGAHCVSPSTLARMSATSRIRTSPRDGCVSTAFTSAATICRRVTSPSRSASVAEPGHQPHHGVERYERIRPAVAGTQDIPGPENRRRQRRVANQALPFRAHLEERAHDRRRLRHADVDEVRGADVARSLDSGAHGRQIDGDEFLGLGRTGMGRADQMHERVFGTKRARRSTPRPARCRQSAPLRRRLGHVTPRASGRERDDLARRALGSGGCPCSRWRPVTRTSRDGVTPVCRRFSPAPAPSSSRATSRPTGRARTSSRLACCTSPRRRSTPRP